MATEQELLAKLKEVFPDACFLDAKTLNQVPHDCATDNLFCETATVKPLCVVKPSDDYTEQLKKLAALARIYKKKVIVFGGGSGVCGAFKVRGGEIVVAMTSLDKIVLIKEPTVECEGLVLAEAGVFGDKLDEFLKQRGYTHGHYPASLAISTVGGWLSTKSNGHLSLYFGNIENLVVAVEGINGRGEFIKLMANDLKKVFRLEGTTMLVTRVWLRVFKIPAHNDFLSFRFSYISNMVNFLRKMPILRDQLKELDVRLYTVRAYDFIDYKFGSRPNKIDTRKSWLTKRISYFIEKQLGRAGQTIGNLAGMLERCGLAPWTVVIYISSDSRKALAQAVKIIKNESQIHNGTTANPAIAYTWYSQRFKLGHSKVVERFRAGITVDTFECPVTWEQLTETYRKIRAIIFRFGLVGAHIGIDLDTPYLYFIFGITGRNRQKYHEARNEILRACVKSGVATTHHHGIGDEVGGKAGPAKTLVPYAYGSDWYHNTATPAKREMDPWNILNPYNLFANLN